MPACVQLLSEMLQLPDTSFSDYFAVNLCTLLCNLRIILQQERQGVGLNVNVKF